MGWPYQQKPPMGWPLDYNSGLVPDAGFWPMIEGSGGQVFDLSGNGNTGTFQNNTLWQPGKFGPTTYYDGTTDSIKMGDILDFEYNQSFTIVISAANATSGSTDLMLSKMQGATDYRGYDFFKTSTEKLTFVLRNDNATGKVLIIESQSTTLFSDGKTHLYAIVYDGSGVGAGVTLYYDGLPIATNIVTDALAGNTILNTANFTIGELDSGGFGWFGTIDYVLIYNRILSAFEIALLYREPFCMFEDPAEIALLGGYQAAVGGKPMWYYQEMMRRAG